MGLDSKASRCPSAATHFCQQGLTTLPQPSKGALPDGAQVFKHLSLWGIVHIQATTQDSATKKYCVKEGGKTLHLKKIDY